MADDGNVVVRVEQPVPIGIEEPDAFAADDVDGPLVGRRLRA